MILNNIKNIINLMERDNIKASTFNYSYNLSGKVCDFTCILRMQDSFSFDLYLTPRNNYDFVIDVEINNSYEISTYLDEYIYQKLFAFLKPNKKNGYKFSTTTFFEDFNNFLFKIDSIQTTNYRQILRIHKNFIKDNDKIYFYGWKRNEEEDHVSNNIYEKTRLAFGKDFAMKMQSLNISAKWTSNKNRENIKILKKYVKE